MYFEVPQGSILRPLLYILYTALAAHYSFNLLQYADDTQIRISTLTRNAEAAVGGLTECLVHTKAWLKASRLRLNPTKTQMM